MILIKELRQLCDDFDPHFCYLDTYRTTVNLTSFTLGEYVTKLLDLKQETMATVAEIRATRRFYGFPTCTPTLEEFYEGDIMPPNALFRKQEAFRIAQLLFADN